MNIQYTNKIKKIKFRANYRGTKESDNLIGNFVTIILKQKNKINLTIINDLEIFLNITDLELMNWILHNIPPRESKNISENFKLLFLSYINTINDKKNL